MPAITLVRGHGPLLQGRFINETSRANRCVLRNKQFQLRGIRYRSRSFCNNSRRRVGEFATETIAFTANGFDQHIMPARAQQLTQCPDVRIHGTVLHKDLIAP